MLGARRMLQWLIQRDTAHGSVLLLGGLVLVLMGYLLVGLVAQVAGFYILSGYARVHTLSLSLIVHA